MEGRAVWQVRMFQKDGGNWFSVESETIYVDFMREWSWTIRNIKYMGEEIAGEYGAHGSVVCAGNEDGSKGSKDYYYIGTSHGYETVNSFSIIVDGVRREYRSGGLYSGKEIEILKRSNLGPLDHEMKISFPGSGDYMIEKHGYQVVDDLKKRFNFLLAFMYENNNTLDQWSGILAGGSEMEGKIPNNGDGKIFLESDIRALIFYSQVMKKGVTLVYPEVYRGAPRGQYKNGAPRNSIVDRKYNNKFYFRPEVRKMGYKVGDTFSYEIKVIPFSADQDGWKSRGKKLAVF